MQFRADTIGLVARRWLRLSLTTILSQVALYFVLLLSLRNMGVSEQEVSTAQVFAVFSFGRLLSASRSRPGGRRRDRARLHRGARGRAPAGRRPPIVAAVLMFRALTYGIQIPLGGVHVPDLAGEEGLAARVADRRESEPPRLGRPPGQDSRGSSGSPGVQAERSRRERSARSSPRSRAPPTRARCRCRAAPRRPRRRTSARAGTRARAPSRTRTPTASHSHFRRRGPGRQERRAPARRRSRRRRPRAPTGTRSRSSSTSGFGRPSAVEEVFSQREEQLRTRPT